MKKKTIYKKWQFWLITLVVVIFLTVVIPFIINESYKMGTGYVTMWGASDILTYYGTALSFIGTAILGVLAFWQNEKANETNKRLIELEKKSKRGYFVPENKIKANGFPWPVIAPHRIEQKGISLLCCGDDNVYVAKAVCNLYGRSIENNNSIFVTNEGEFSKLYIPVELNDQERKLDELNIDLTLYLQNSRMYQYKQTLNLIYKKRKDGAYNLCGFNSTFEDIDEV